MKFLRFLSTGYTGTFKMNIITGRPLLFKKKNR